MATLEKLRSYTENTKTTVNTEVDKTKTANLEVDRAINGGGQDEPMLQQLLRNLIAFQETLNNLISLLKNEDEDEEYTRPTNLALYKALSLIYDAYNEMSDKFPQASAYSDEEGGIRLRWRNLTTNREVRLYCASETSKKSYVYYEDKNQQIYEAITDKEVGLELNKHLVQRLNWLVR